MAEVKGLWVPIFVVAVVLIIIGVFVYISLTAPEEETDVIMMSVQDPVLMDGNYSVSVYVINHLGDGYNVRAEYFTLHSGVGDIQADADASSLSPMYLVDGQSASFHLVFHLPVGTPLSLEYDDPSLTSIIMNL